MTLLARFGSAFLVGTILCGFGFTALASTPYWVDYLDEQATVDPAIRVGQKLYNAKQYQQAADQFEAFLAKSTDTLQRCEAQYDLGRTLVQLQFFNRATEQWTQVAASMSCPQGPEALLGVASVHGALGKWDAAIHDYENLVNRFPNSSERQEAWFQVIQSYRNKGDIKGAAERFHKYKAIYPTDTRNDAVSEELTLAGDGTSDKARDIILIRGKRLFADKKYENARWYFEDLVHSYPGSRQAQEADSYLKQIREHLIDDLLDPRQQQGTAPEEFLWTRALQSCAEEEYDLAQTYFDRIVTAYPNTAHAKEAKQGSKLCRKRFRDATEKRP